LILLISIFLSEIGAPPDSTCAGRDEGHARGCPIAHQRFKTIAWRHAQEVQLLGGKELKLWVSLRTAAAIQVDDSPAPTTAFIHWIVA
jgi:hypothetical protein